MGTGLTAPTSLKIAVKSRLKGSAVPAAQTVAPISKR